MVDVWLIECFRRNQPIRFLDNSVDDDWSVVLHVWVIGKGMTYLDMPDNLLAEWPEHAPKNPLDALAEALKEAKDGWKI